MLPRAHPSGWARGWHAGIGHRSPLTSGDFRKGGGSLRGLCPLKFLEGFLSLKAGTLSSLMSAVADQLGLWPHCYAMLSCCLQPGTRIPGLWPFLGTSACPHSHSLNSPEAASSQARADDHMNAYTREGEEPGAQAVTGPQCQQFLGVSKGGLSCSH